MKKGSLGKLAKESADVFEGMMDGDDFSSAVNPKICQSRAHWRDDLEDIHGDALKDVRGNVLSTRHHED
jgi:hypothetical protein